MYMSTRKSRISSECSGFLGHRGPNCADTLDARSSFTLEQEILG